MNKSVAQAGLVLWIFHVSCTSQTSSYRGTGTSRGQTRGAIEQSSPSKEDVLYKENPYLAFAGLCEDRSDPESTFTAEQLKLKFQVSNCETLYQAIRSSGSIELVGLNLRNISLLGFARNAVKLDLRDNSITDLTAVSGLSNLRYLDVSNNLISDLAPLSQLTQLRELGVSENKLVRLDALQNMMELRLLKASKNAIKDLTPLAQLKALEDLSIHTNKITEVKPLASLTRLRSLNLQYNLGITDIESLSPLKNLEFLDIQETAVTNLAFLSQHAGLTELAIMGGPFTNLQALNTLVQLQKLKISNQVGPEEDLNTAQPINYSFLNSMPRLKSLELSDLKVSDLSFLATCRSLEFLSLVTEFITTTNVLSQLTALKELILFSNVRSDGQFLANLKALERLELPFGELSNLSFLSSLPQLRILDISSNPIADLSPLSQARNLIELRMDDVGATSVAPLAALSRLERLSLRRNNIKDLTPLGTIIPLKSLDLTLNASEVNLQALAALKNLESLSVNGLSNLSFKGIDNLTSLKVLSAFSSNVSSCQELRPLGHLENVNLSLNNLTDLSCLQGALKIRMLNLSNNAGVKSLAPVSAMRGIESLMLNETGIRDLEALRGKQLLRALQIKNTGVTSLEPLTMLYRLDELDVTGTMLTALGDKTSAGCSAAIKGQAMKSVCDRMP